MLIALDIGNANTLCASHRHLERRRSFIHVLTEGELLYPNTEYLTINHGSSFAIGDDAALYRRYHQLADMTNKYDAALPIALHVLPRHTKESTFEATVSCPDPSRYADSVRSSLDGMFEYAINKDWYKVNINVVEVLPEGFGSYWRAKSQGKLKDTGRTLVIDIGAGTVCTLLMDNRTDRTLESNAREKTGVIDLANALAGDVRFKRELGDTPEASVILDGLMAECQYAETGVDFSDYLSDYLFGWFSSIHNDIKSLYSAQIKNVTNFLFTGGGSLLVSHRINNMPGDKFQVSQNPLIDNVIGMYEYAKR